MAHHGKDATLSIDDSADAVKSITAYCQSVNLTRPREVAETTAMSSTTKTFIAGLPDGGTLSFEGLADPTLDGYLHGILGVVSIGGALGDFSHSPDGGTTTYSGKHILTSYSIKTSRGDAATFSAESQTSGAISRA